MTLGEIRQGVAALPQSKSSQIRRGWNSAVVEEWSVARTAQRAGLNRLYHYEKFNSTYLSDVLTNQRVHCSILRRSTIRGIAGRGLTQKQLPIHRG
jgi:hypothetical protein